MNKVLGKGSYGSVELARHKKSKKLYAIKVIQKNSLANQRLKENLYREVDIHKQIKHENIIRLYDSFEDDQNIYLVLDYAERGNLFYLIRRKQKLTED